MSSKPKLLADENIPRTTIRSLRGLGYDVVSIWEAGPGKLEPGDVIGNTTHLSLVAGSCARNLVAILGVHVYRAGEGGVAPDSGAVSTILDAARSRICGPRRGRLY